MKIKNIALCGLFSAFLCICAWLSVPFGSGAFTLQTFGIFLCLGILGGKLGTIAVAAYLLLGAAGFPAFFGFRGGFGPFLDPAGGFLSGFLAASLTYWLITSLLGYKPRVRLFAMVTGLLVCYAFGSFWFYVLCLQSSSPVTLGFVLLQCVVPYLLPDILKLLLAWQLGKRLPLLK